MIPLRGNLDTRMKKIESEGLAGIILAAAGIHRMGLQDKISQYLDLEYLSAGRRTGGPGPGNPGR